MDRLIRASAAVIKQFQPNPRKRSEMSVAIRAKYGLTRRDANRILGLSHATRAEAKVPRDDSILIQLLKEYFHENPGQGFGMVFKALLEKQPYTRSRMYEIYKSCDYLLKHRPKKKIAIPRRIYRPMEVQVEPGIQIWSMDFMVDVLPSGERFWVLNVLDDFNREAIVVKVLPRNTTKAVVEALETVRASRRQPSCIRTDNAAEFKSVLYKAWTKRYGISRKYSRPREAM